MKYMIINGSPRKKCNTAQMLASFADGMGLIKSHASFFYKIVDSFTLSNRALYFSFSDARQARK